MKKLNRNALFLFTLLFAFIAFGCGGDCTQDNQGMLADGDEEAAEDTDEPEATEAPEDAEEMEEAEEVETPEGEENEEAEGEEGEGEIVVDYPVSFHTLHFDLEDTGFVSPEEEYRLHIGGNHFILTPHTDESKEEFSDLFASLQESDHPTHYVENAPMPSHKPTLIHVTQHTDESGTIQATQGDVPHALTLMLIHIPVDAVQNQFKKRKLSKSKVLGTKRNDGDLTPDELNTYGPDDIAHALLFHHPDMLNLNSDAAANIMYNHIMQAVGVDALATAIQNAGQNNWYEMQPITDEDGEQEYDSNGNPMYNYQPKQEILEAAKTALQNALNGVHNDSSLKGQSWNYQDGTSHITEDADDETNPQTRADGYTFKLAKTGWQSGLHTSMSYSGTSVTVEFNNNYVRHLSAFVEFYDENDNPVTPESWDTFFSEWDFTNASDFETDTVKYLTLVNPVPTIAGIPIPGDFNRSSVTFDWPMNARYCKILAGGLGNGGPHETNVVAIGATMTSIFELAIPTILLASTAAEGDMGALFETLGDDIALASTVVGTLYSLLWTHTNSNFGDIAAKLGVAAANFVWQNKKIRRWVVEKIAESELEKAVPFVGTAFWVADMAATAASLAQTSVEVAKSPWTIQNRITPSHDIHVTINHAEDNYQFPAVATHFKVLAKFSNNDTRVINVTLPVDPETGDPVTVSEPRHVTFDNVPAGGKVTIKAFFYSDTGWLAAQKEVKNLDNVNDDGEDSMSVEFAIDQNLVPLDESSVYTHKVVLQYDDTEGYYWHGITTPPTETLYDLSNSTSENAMSELVVTTISQKLGMQGYIWRSYSPDQEACPNQATGGHLYYMKNINMAEDPNVGMMTTSCGYSSRPYLLYDFMAEKDDAKNFAVIEKDGIYYVRMVAYTDDGVMTIPEQSVGKFPARVDSMIYHPFGFLVGINHNHGKLYSLNITSTPVEDAYAPMALPLSGPATTIEGMKQNPTLLRHPIGIKLSRENTLLVLDDIHELTAGTSDASTKARVKAYNLLGDPIPYFNNGEDYALDLVEQTPDVQVYYLDFGVESMGYIYTLSYAVASGGEAGNVTADDYRLDIYKPDGTFLVRTQGFAAARMAVDKWRNVKTLNYGHFIGANGLTEPTASEWIPPTPPAADGDEDTQ